METFGLAEAKELYNTMGKIGRLFNRLNLKLPE